MTFAGSVFSLGRSIDYFRVSAQGALVFGSGGRLLAHGARVRAHNHAFNRFVRRVRDLAQVEGEGRITEALARDGLARIGVDEDGLDRLDRQVLTALSRAGGRPLGLKTIAAAVGEDERTLEDVCEPHLLREGYLVKTPQGRQLTPSGWLLLGGTPPASEATYPLPLG